MKKFLAAIICTNFSIISQEIFFGPGEIHYDVDDAMQLYQERGRDGLLALEEICHSQREFFYYACYSLGKIYYEKGQKQKAKFFLEKSLEKKDFVYAINFYLLYFQEIPNLKNKALYHYLRAQKFLRQKKKPSMIKKEVELSLAEGAPVEWFSQNPDFMPYIKNINVGDGDKLNFALLSGKKIAHFLDPAYTYEKHLSNPDLSQITYEYWEALKNSGDLNQCQKNLQNFLINLEKVNFELAAHALIFIWQRKEFAGLKTQDSWKDFSINFGKKYGIHKDFFN